MTDKPKNRGITLVRLSYQPIKSELEAVIPPPMKSDGTMPTPEELARGVLQPVNINRKDRP